MSATAGAEAPIYFGPKVERTALEFEGVTFRVFPLRANPYRLERFCDDYLNMDLPPEIAYFRPALPYVLLQAINYGRMSPKASNLGWVSQNEVTFAVPLEWYRKREGGWVFVDWATVSPFIFVDDDLSTAEGREIYGWPKILSTIEAEADPWMEDPRCRRRLLTLRTLMFSELYKGRRLEPRTLLQLEQRIPETASQWPPDLSYLLRPWLAPGGAAAGGLDAAADLALTAANRWRATGDPGLGALLEVASRTLTAGPPRMYGNTVNLKQFRGDEPRAACYQALVKARLDFKKFHGGGALGDVELWRGDPSGGLRIRIRRHPAYPIVGSLGLEVKSRERGEGRPVDVLSPQFPIWFKADLRYQMGERIGWRIESETWRRKSGEAGAGSGRRPRYNTALGPVVQAVEEPYDFWDATVHVILLAAEARALDSLVERHLPLPEDVLRVGLLPGGQKPGEGEIATVLLFVSNYGEVSTQANDIGRWAQREVGFAVLVWVRPAGKNEKGREWSEFPALFWPYAFADSPIAVRTDREVTGTPTVQARISGGLDPWIEGQGPGRRLLTLTTGGYPALHVGAQRRQKVLLEIEGRTPPLDLEPLVERLKKMPKEKWIEYLEGLGEHPEDLVPPPRPVTGDGSNGLEIDHLVVKQFRDAREPRLACYQAVVAARSFVGKWRGESAARVEPDPTRYRVLLRHSASHPIAEELGLRTGPPLLDEEGGRVFELEPREIGSGGASDVHAFTMQVDLRHYLSRTLCWRGAGRPTWSRDESGIEYLEQRAARHLPEIRDFETFFDELRNQVDGHQSLGADEGAAESVRSVDA